MFPSTATPWPLKVNRPTITLDNPCHNLEVIDDIKALPASLEEILLEGIGTVTVIVILPGGPNCARDGGPEVDANTLTIVSLG